MFSKPVRITYLSMILTAALVIIGGVIVSTTAGGGRLWKDKAKETAAAAQRAQFIQTVRVWVHGDRVSPDLIYARPGRILLQAENQTGADISLKFDRRAASGNAVAQGLVRTARQGKRSSQEVTLDAGEYVFYDEARPWIKGKLIVDPQLDRK
jgi:hypothetical protein